MRYMWSNLQALLNQHVQLWQQGKCHMIKDAQLLWKNIQATHGKKGCLPFIRLFLIENRARASIDLGWLHNHGERGYYVILHDAAAPGYTMHTYALHLLHDYRILQEGGSSNPHSKPTHLRTQPRITRALKTKITTTLRTRSRPALKKEAHKRAQKENQLRTENGIICALKWGGVGDHHTSHLTQRSPAHSKRR